MDTVTFRRTYHERNAGPGALWDAYASQQLDRQTMRAVILDVWSAAEWPQYTLTTDAWLSMFEWAAYEAPTSPMTLYRGAPARYARGMAWTTDRDRAIWFAGRLPLAQPAYVYTATVEPAGILAVVDELEANGRREAEVIVDPGYLPRPVRRVRSEGPGPCRSVAATVRRTQATAPLTQRRAGR
jgi:hypothetical protein